MIKISHTFDAVKLTLKSRKHLGVTVVSSAFMFFLAILIPTVLIPGNTIDYQISLFTWESALLTILFSILFGISMAMHSYASYLRKLKKDGAIGERAGVGFFSITGTLFASKLCPMCLSAIFSFVGLGSSAVFFILSFRFPILILSILLVLISIYFAGKRINN